MKSKQKPALHQDWIDPNAIEIVQRLDAKGFTTYLVGGCVRDLLVGLHPKDYDIATTARPEEIRRFIPRSFIIGKRFRLVLVKRGEQQYEVATFRRNFEIDPAAEGEEAPPIGDNIFGSPEEDASRRDFTINSLFYDPVRDELIDYSSGLPDLEERVLRMIGAPVERFIEDPIRILRAIRLSHKLGFSLDPELRRGIAETCHTLPNTVLPRRREEILKILRLDNPALTLQETFDLGVLQYLSPKMHEIFSDPQRREVFLSYIQRLPQLVLNPQDPIELFGVLTLAFLRSLTDLAEEGQSLRAFKEEHYNDFFKNELGMFKYEQSFILKALHIAQALEKTEDFKRKGERRRLAILKNESFPLSLLLVEADYLLSPENINFWHQHYQEALPQIRELNKDKPRNGNRRKKWNRGKKSKGKTPAS